MQQQLSSLVLQLRIVHDRTTVPVKQISENSVNSRNLQSSLRSKVCSAKYVLTCKQRASRLGWYNTVVNFLQY
jgi:hypothetical protein